MPKKDALDPARGITYGLIISTFLWTLFALAWVALTP